jgi:hypothetical protein
MGWVADELVRLMWVTCIHQMLERPIWAWPICPAPPLPPLEAMATWDEAMQALQANAPPPPAIPDGPTEDEDMGVWEVVDDGTVADEAAGGGASSSTSPPSLDLLVNLLRDLRPDQREEVMRRARR